MISRKREISLECVFKSSDTANPHIRLFPGMPGRHPGADCRQRRAAGDFSHSSFRYWPLGLG
jgi:hypothetical protein